MRVWVAGCSTGQEVYSMAMAYQEFCEKRSRAPELQMFATDLNEALLEKARQGLYPDSLAEDVSPERLRRFFVEEEGGYRISKALRERCVFARQNLLSDPPFSRLDLISCRNLLIYIEAGSQQKILPTFHYALKPNGFLFLGASESIGALAELFEPVDKKMRIFSPQTRGDSGLHCRFPAAAGKGAKPGAPAGRRCEGQAGEANAQREADRVIANRVRAAGGVGRCQPADRAVRGARRSPTWGRPRASRARRAEDGAGGFDAAAAGGAQEGAGSTARSCARRMCSLSHDGQGRRVNLEVIPLKNLKERYYLVCFEEAPGQKAGRAGGQRCQRA